jgi:transcriptional regulator with XRE-family HTH domain
MTTSKSTHRSVRGRLANGAANPVDTHVGARMRLRRSLLGMSQERLGDLIGLSFQQVQKYERGGNRISASRLFDLAQVLDVPVGYFFDDMSDAVRGQSPVAVIYGVAPAATAPASDAVTDPLTSRETLELVRHYHDLPTKLRDQIRMTVKAMSESMAGEAA